MKIKEIIVVEGKNDTAKIKQAVEADTLETNGSAISPATLNLIKIAQARRGVIVLTDPDYPGEKIRKIISAHIPGVKHAFILKQEAKAKKGRSLGIEHAPIEVIQKALSLVREEAADAEESIPWQMLLDYDLIGGGNARKRREMLGDSLNIGYMNGKQLYKRLNMFQITIEELEAAIAKMEGDGNEKRNYS